MTLARTIGKEETLARVSSRSHGLAHVHVLNAALYTQAVYTQYHRIPWTILRKKTHELTVKRNNTDNEANAQHHDDERVNLESGTLVCVQLEHRRAAAAGACGASARRTGIGDFVCAVGGGAAADGGSGSAGRFGRGGARAGATGHRG